MFFMNLNLAEFTHVGLKTRYQTIEKLVLKYFRVVKITQHKQIANLLKTAGMKLVV